jgi:NAD(P)-dependent dehydrogenase (short-subunit alcohol dehydrogenase family)
VNDLGDQVAVVTGASGGIGGAIAAAFARPKFSAPPRRASIPSPAI